MGSILFIYAEVALQHVTIKVYRVDLLKFRCIIRAVDGHRCDCRQAVAAHDTGSTEPDQLIDKPRVRELCAEGAAGFDQGARDAHPGQRFENGPRIQPAAGLNRQCYDGGTGGCQGLNLRNRGFLANKQP